MRERARRRIRWSLGTIALLWLLLAGLDQFLEIGTINLDSNYRSGALQQQMANCRGTFQERYQCKSAILRASGQQSF